MTYAKYLLSLNINPVCFLCYLVFNSDMDHPADWDGLPGDILIVIAHMLTCCEDLYRISAVSKSWNSIVSGLSRDKKPLQLPPESPLLFLAEQVAEGSAFSCDFNDEYHEEGMVEINVEDEDEDEDQDEEHYCYHELYDYRKSSVTGTRGLHRLATGKNI